MRLAQSSWWQALAIYRKPQVLAMLALGFAAGLPYLLVFSTLSTWLRDEGVSRTAIGFLSWVGILYSIKVIWAPLLDRVRVPGLTVWLGRRRSWMLVAQLLLMLGLLGMALCDPRTQLLALALCALLVAFASATQDIALDAYRIEIVDTDWQGAMAASYTLGYRVALLVAGAGALYIAEWWSWSVAYVAMALGILAGVVTVLLVAEPAEVDAPMVPDAGLSFSRRLLAPLWQPVWAFIQRYGRQALLILAFIGLYRLSDLIFGVMANPFYLDIGFSKTDIANVSKIFGFAMTLLGAFVAGVLVVRFQVMGPLLLAGVLIALTNLLFLLLAWQGPELHLFVLAISADNFSNGMATAAFVAYLSSLTQRGYTATQYALFSSLMTLPGKLLAGFAGVWVDALGYEVFFVLTTVLGIPGVVLGYYLWRRPLRSGL